MAITITPVAEERIQKILRKRQDSNSWLKISLRGGGCSGYMYHYDFVSTPDEKDKTFEFDHIKICIDRKSYIFLNGTEIDYEEDLFKSGLVFNNPNAARSCGCGESVTFSG